MANYATLKAAIAAAIKQNGNNEITGNLLQQQLLAMVNSLGAGYQYAGIATPATNPGTPDQNVFYLASTSGTYTNFGGLVLADGEIAILKYNGAWSKDSTGAASLEKLNQLGQEVEGNVGFSNLLRLVSNTTPLFERGGFNYSGGNASNTRRVRTINPVNTGVFIGVPAGWRIVEVFYYSAWTDSSTFTMTGNESVNGRAVYLKTDYPLARISIGKDPDAVFIPAEFYIALGQQIDARAGILNLTQMVDSGFIEFEQGTQSAGKNRESTSRIRTINAHRLPMYIAVPDGYIIHEVALYSMWNSAEDYTYIRDNSIGKNYYNFLDGVPEGYVARFTIRKADNTDFTPNDFYAALNLVSPKIDKLAGFLGEPKTASLSGTIITLTNDVVYKVVSSNISPGAEVVGKNLLDKSSFKSKKILNDSGVEVSDNTSSYYSWLIPCHGKTLLSTKGMQRVYKYDADGVFLGRESADVNRFSYVVPSDTYFVQIQISGIADDNYSIIYSGSGELEYEPYYRGTTIPPSGACSIYNTDYSEVSVDLAILCKAIIPEVGTYDFWEPASVTDDYKCTSLGQYTQSIPSLNTLGYNGFLATYFDNYLGKYSDGYEVKKIELGMDSGAEVELSACPLFSYEFIPKYYNKTVLLSAGMNTCEASTYFGLAYFVKALMEHTEDGMLALYNTARFVIIPVICPTGISHDPLLYRNANDVRVNKNFSYLGSWKYNYERGGQYPGAYPDSEVETKLLKAWMNKYNGATFYMDCHSDTGGATGQELALSQCFCSDTATKNKVAARKDEITAFYRSKGYIAVGDTPTFRYENENGLTYPKTTYSKTVCGTPAIMHEQYIMSTAYGSDGHTNNDDYGIKNYVALIRWYCLIMCKSPFDIVI